MKQKIFILSPEKNTTKLLLKNFLLLIIIHYCSLEKCTDKNYPFLLNNECVQTCQEEEIDANLCKIENEIIKTQYLNSIIYINEEKCIYFNIVVSENNNLYYLLSSYRKSKNRFLYLLNNEGYGLINKESPFFITALNETKPVGRYESVIFIIKLLSDSDNNEYLLSLSKSNQYLEIYDFVSNNVYFQRAEIVLGNGIANIFSVIGTNLKLKKANNTYIIGLLAYISNQNNIFDVPYFYLEKGNFTSLDIVNNKPIFDSIRIESSKAKIVSCYETSSNFIVCFYQNPEFKYIMIVYDYDLNEKTNITISEGSSKEGNNNLFFKCIHFFEDTGVFGYFSNDENPIIIFKFKKYSNIDNIISDCYDTIPELSINDIFFNNESVAMCDMIKIEDKKFYYVGASFNQEILYIISIYNYYDDNFVKRIYSINIKYLNNYTLKNKIQLALYKNFLAIGSWDEINQHPSLIIFSYANTTETYLDLIDYLYKNDDIKIYSLILKLKGEYVMVNNLFGYIYSGIQIIENCNDANIYLADSNNKKVANYFLPKNKEIKLIIPKNDIYSPFICKLKYATVVTEPDYLEYNNYPINVNYIGGNENEEKSFFQRKNYIGKYNFYNLKLTDELKEVNCEDNCELCINNTNYNYNCVTCKYSSNIENNLKICQNKTFNLTDYLKNLFKNYNNKDNIVKNITNDIEKGLLNSLISNVIGGGKKDVIINDNETIYQITSTENQKNNKNNKNNNISTIILGECEKILKDKYKIDENQPLIIFKIDYYKEGSLIPIIGYEVFHPENNSKLDLKYCKDEIVNFSIPVVIDEDNFFKYDPNNEYYTDQCNPYTTENGTDILLNDRQNEYNENNMALCENNCELNSYDSDTKQVVCDCKVKYKQIVISEIINQTDLLYYNFTEKNESSTMETMKCYYTLFTKDGMLTNIANYILLFTIVLFMISGILFYKCGYHLLEGKIKEIILLRNEKIKRYENMKDSNVKNNKEKIHKNDKNNKNNKNKKKKQNNKYIKKKLNINITINKRKIKDKNNQKSSSKIELNYSKKIKYLNNKSVPNNLDSKKIFNDYELNSMPYKDALKLDKRSYFDYYISLIKTKHPIIFSFYPIKDYNSKIIKIDLFFLSFSIYYFINALFYNEKVIHKIYKEEGIYNFIYLIPFILYSFIISHFIFIIIKYFCLSERNICEINYISIKKRDNIIYKVKRCITIKYICFYILGLIFLIFFWFSLSSFGAVFQNTQIFLIKSTLISFGFSLIYPFIINLIPGIFRIYSLKNSKRKSIYTINSILQLI